MDATVSRNLLTWLASVDEWPEAVVLGCEHTEPFAVERSQVGLRIPGCLGQAELALPAQLLACGVTKVLLADCAENPQAVARQRSAWHQLLPDVDPDPAKHPARFRRTGAVFELARPAFSRRSALGLGAPRTLPLDADLDDQFRTVQALRLLRDQGRTRAAAAAAAAVTAEQAAPESTPPALGAERSGAGQIGAEQSVAVELRAVGCTACGVCVRACAHQALSLTHDGERTRLSHNTDLCRADQNCVRLCPESALSAIRELSVTDLADRGAVELAAMDTRVCSRCGDRHADTRSDLCPPCRSRSENAFGSQLPPALQARLKAQRRAGTAPTTPTTSA